MSGGIKIPGKLTRPIAMCESPEIWTGQNRSPILKTFELLGWLIKGQVISKAIYGLLTSPKKRTNKFVFLS